MVAPPRYAIKPCRNSAIPRLATTHYYTRARAAGGRLFHNPRSRSHHACTHQRLTRRTAPHTHETHHIVNRQHICHLTVRLRPATGWASAARAIRDNRSARAHSYQRPRPLCPQYRDIRTGHRAQPALHKTAGAHSPPSHPPAGVAGNATDTVLSRQAHQFAGCCLAAACLCEGRSALVAARHPTVVSSAPSSREGGIELLVEGLVLVDAPAALA